MIERLTTFMPAGGLGSRLRPHTLEIPKPMLLMGAPNKRVIDHPLEIITEHCDKVWVSVDYLAEEVEEYLGNKPNVCTLRDEKTIGSGGSLLAHYEEVLGQDSGGDLLVLPSDHIYDGDFNIEKYWEFHKESGAAMTLMTVPVKTYGEFLSIEHDTALRIERHPNPFSVSTTGTYMFRNDFILDVLMKVRHDVRESLNIYKDIVCPSVGSAEVRSFFVGADQGFWEDAGTLERFLQCNMRLSGNRNVISPEAFIEESVRLDRCVVLGNAILTGEISIEDSVVSSAGRGELLISRPEQRQRLVA